MTKKYVSRQLESFYSDVFTGNLEDVFLRLIELKNKYPDHTNFSITVDPGYDGPDEYTLYGSRIENDDEYLQRLTREAKAREKKELAKERAKKAAITTKKNRETRQRAQYEKLKKLYGNT